MGTLFESDSASARRTLLLGGVGALTLFVLLRVTNAYGNPSALIAHSTPGDWHPLPTLSKTIILFLDVEKYPPSLQFLLMTLGPILILLAIGGARFWGRFGTVLETYGRVPLFFYILHLYVIHLAAGLLGFLTHQPVAWLLHGGFFLNYPPDGQSYGHGLGVVCAMWAARDSVALLALCLVCTRQREAFRLAIAVPLVKQLFVGINAFRNHRIQLGMRPSGPLI